LYGHFDKYTKIFVNCSTCSHQKKTCLGQPCVSITITPPTTALTTPTPMGNQPPVCVEGWTKWLSHDNQKYRRDVDTESLPTVAQLVSSSVNIKEV
jgi:hypothetical protein